MGLALSTLSCAGEVRLGVLTDQGLVTEAGTIVRAFLDESAVVFSKHRERRSWSS